MSEQRQLSAIFVQHAADFLAVNGLTGSQIARKCAAYAIEFNVEIPHGTPPLQAPNKRTALYENLMAFSEPQRYKIILGLLNDPSIASRNSDGAQNLKLQLMTRYGHLASESLGSAVSERLIEQTRHWLDSFPEVLKLYNHALQKYESKTFHRNLLDDLRLSLEKLLQALLGNSKSLENQLSPLGEFLKRNGGSKEFTNMVRQLLEYYGKYQNAYVKHDDAVIDCEIEFVVEFTSSLMKHMVRTAAPKST
jgi:hypothetical protein